MRPVPSLTAPGPEWDRFVLTSRPARRRHDPWQAHGVFVEDECGADGTIAAVVTVLLTGRECPWRCVMCDLWKQTLAVDTPPEALCHQLDRALRSAGIGVGQAGRMRVKLYNAGSFFDPRAVPEQDYDGIAQRVARFSHVVVESHPALIGPRLTRFRDALARTSGDPARPTLEVAMGLETAHPDALRLLRKGFSLDDFRDAAGELRRRGASLRVFLLVGVPFIPRAEQLDWICRSVAFAFESGASAVSLIPTRSGNGALEALAAAGTFEPPTLADIETAFERSLPRARGRLFVDLWDLDAFASCPACFADRRERLRRMNLEQRLQPPVSCPVCAREAGRS